MVVMASLVKFNHKLQKGITMFKFLLISIIGSAMLFNINIAQAEDGQRYDDSVTWKSVVRINYKPGKMGDALKIIKDYYRKASEQAKTPMPELIMEMQTGDYDLIVVWHMEGGITDMTWETGPNDKKWRAALNELAGGEDKAQAILDEYLSYIDDASSDIALVK